MATAPRAFAEWGQQAEVFLRPGTERSYAGVDAVLPLYQSGESLFATDLKGHLGEADTHELNLGLFWRKLVADRRWALGLYGAVDRRRSPFGNDFSQVTTGAEARSDDWDFRLNYYHPSTDRQLVGLGDFGFSGFGIRRNGIYEEAMKGFDVEVGRLLPFSGQIESRLYVTGYRFEGEDVAPTTDGWRLRFEMRPWRNISISLSSQDDDLFGNQHSIEVRYIIGKQSKPGVRLLNERMTDPWHRDIDVVVSPAIESQNPALATVIPGDKVVHVDSTKAAGGDGSFEQPYDSVTACTADKCVDPTYNMVRLWKGSSSTGSPYDPISLQAGQTLWGEGFNIFTGAATGNLPVIGNGATAVTLADNTTVAGVYASGSISGNNVNGNLSIHHNIIQSSGNGIDIYNSNDGLVANITIANNTINASNSAVHIGNYANGGTLQQTVSITGNTLTGSSFGVDLRNYAYGYGSSATQTVTLSNNTINSGDTAVRSDNSASYDGVAQQTVALTGNTLTGSNFGVYLRNNAYYSYYYGSSATQTVTLSGNTISSNDTAVRSDNTATYGGATAQQTVTLTGNTLTGSNYGVDLRNNANDYGDSAIQTVTLSGNTVSATSYYGGYGLFARNDAGYYGTATQNVTLSGETITSNGVGGRGLQLDNYAYDGTATQTVTLQNATVNATSGTGINMSSSYYYNYYYGATATQTVTLQNTTLNAPTPVAISGYGTCTGGGVAYCP